VPKKNIKSLSVIKILKNKKIKCICVVLKRWGNDFCGFRNIAVVQYASQ